MKYFFKTSLFFLLISCFLSISCTQNASSDDSTSNTSSVKTIPYAVEDDYDIVFQVINASGMDLTIQPSLTTKTDGYIFNNPEVSIKNNELKIFHFKYDTLTKIIKDKYGNKYSDLNDVYIISKINDTK